uniref:PDZ domain-containing protein n=1 Tax=Plectus sambesii TaxID=2011161 RepID=A0A914UX12_9BILA
MPLSVSLVGGPPWGFRIGPPDNGNGAIVAQVITDGRAANEGIRPNDRILAVNGKSTSDLSPAELHRLIKRGTGILRLQIERRRRAPGESALVQTTVSEYGLIDGGGGMYGACKLRIDPAAGGFSEQKQRC